MQRESTDPCVYSVTNVLENKLRIRNEEALRAFKYEQSNSRLQELNRKPIDGKFDLDHLKAIHRHLFQDVYAWVGEIRTVNISKDRVPFAPVAFIESYIATLAANLSKENYLRGLETTGFVQRLAHYFTEFNAVHPFRKGNGR